jgi:predicted dehydrogenase
MGTQIHASENYRRVVEAVRAGAAGRVHTVHAFCNKTWSAEGTPTGTHAVPESLDYDLWLGPVRAIPYHPDYHPGGWRRYWHFGGGTLADMGCHYLDLAFWALELRHPVAVEAHGPPAHPAAAPASLSVRWSFAALAGAGPLELWWHDGGRRPAALAELGLDDWQSGVLFLGDEGALVADYTRLRVVRNRGEWTAPAPSLAPSRGHHREWLAACRGGERPTCAFDYSGALTEAVLLGSVAHRLGRALEWDARALVARGSPEADALLRGDYRDGWALAR